MQEFAAHSHIVNAPMVTNSPFLVARDVCPAECMPKMCTDEATLKGTATVLTYLCPPTPTPSSTKQRSTIYITVTEYTTVTPVASHKLPAISVQPPRHVELETPLFAVPNQKSSSEILYTTKKTTSTISKTIYITVHIPTSTPAQPSSVLQSTSLSSTRASSTSSPVSEPYQAPSTMSQTSEPTQDYTSFPTYSVTGTQGVHAPSGIINSSYVAYPGPTAGGHNNTYVINRKALAARNGTGTLFDDHSTGNRLGLNGVLAIMMAIMVMMRIG